MRTRTKKLLFSAGIAAGALVASAPEAHAVDWIIKRPGSHPGLSVELEPHANLIFFRFRDYGGKYRGRNFGAWEGGGGFRASIELADPMFIKSINNSIAISFGLDLTNCRYCYGNDFLIWSPVALQWNFYLTRRWSVFGEAGGIVRSEGFFRDVWIDPAIWIGGRFHFNDKIALTMRAGAPWFSIGVSFYVGS